MAEETYEFTDVTDFKDVLEKILPRLEPGQQKLLLTTQILKYCGLGYKPFVEYLLPKCDWDHYDELTVACAYGHIDIVKLLYIDTTPDFIRDRCFRVACKKGHADIVEMMLERGANDWELGLSNACESGNMTIIQKIIDKLPPNTSRYMWNRAFMTASVFNHIDAAELMIKHGALDFNNPMEEAAHEGRLDMVKYCVSKGATSYEESLDEAIDEGHEAVAMYLRELIRQRDSADITCMCREESLQYVAKLLGV